MTTETITTTITTNIKREIARVRNRRQQIANDLASNPNTANAALSYLHQLAGDIYAEDKLTLIDLTGNHASLKRDLKALIHDIELDLLNDRITDRAIGRWSDKVGAAQTRIATHLRQFLSVQLIALDTANAQ